MHVMRDTEAWLSWLEHTVHIREVTGSSPVASTTFYQSAPVADWFFIFLDFFLQNINTAFILSKKHNLLYFEVMQSNLTAHKSFKPLFI